MRLEFHYKEILGTCFFGKISKFFYPQFLSTYPNFWSNSTNMLVKLQLFPVTSGFVDGICEKGVFNQFVKSFKFLGKNVAKFFNPII